MNEFGESPIIYFWPAGHDEGEVDVTEFFTKLHNALDAAGIEWESA